MVHFKVLYVTYDNGVLWLVNMKNKLNLSICSIGNAYIWQQKNL